MNGGEIVIENCLHWSTQRRKEWIKKKRDRIPYEWKPCTKCIMVDQGLEVGEWENRLLWKLKMASHLKG
jgi:hypothetical protein